MQAIKTTTDQQQNNQKAPDLESSETNVSKTEIRADHITLTEDEVKLATERAIKQALIEKRTNYIQQEYFRRVNNPTPVRKFSADEYLSAAENKWMRSTNLHFIRTAENLKVLETLSWYFTRDDRFLDAGEHFSFEKGIYLYGNVGCGKTTIMRMFQHNPLASYIVVSARKVASEFARGGDDGKGGYPAIERYFGVYMPDSIQNFFRHQDFGFCFDDLGTETEKQNFGNKSNVLGEILLNRYDQLHSLKSKTHITSNLSAKEVEEVYGVRVRSRMREMFNIISFPLSAPDMRQ